MNAGSLLSGIGAPEADTTWLNYAACRGHDPNMWHPHKNQNTLASRAKTICAGCPVRIPCLETELERTLNGNPGSVGIFGGLTSRERNLLLRRQGHRPRGRVPGVAS